MWHGISSKSKPNNFLWNQCAIPVFEDLLPEPHNSQICKLLFHFAHWHGLAKLRLHSDDTLKLLDDETTELGDHLRKFQSNTCAAFQTKELGKEASARHRRQAKQDHKSRKKPTARNSTTSQENAATGDQAPQRKPKEFNLNTYKMHALGDYVETIRQYGTTDSYSTELVRWLNSALHSSWPHSCYCNRGSLNIELQRAGTSGPQEKGISSSLLRLNAGRLAYEAYVHGLGLEEIGVNRIRQLVIYPCTTALGCLRTFQGT